MSDTPGGTGANLTKTQYARGVEAAVYDKAKFLPLIQEWERGFNQLIVRKIAAGTGATLASTQDGTTMTFDSMGPTTITMSPTWLFTGRSYPDSLPWTAGEDIDADAAADCEGALAAYLDTQLLADVASLTANVGNNATDIDAALWRSALASLYNSAKVLAEPGKSDIQMLLGALQVDDVLSIPEFTNADQRGDGQNPLVSGMVSKGVGVRANFTTLLSSDGNGLHGVMFVRSAFGYFFNKRPSGERQRYLKQTRVMADCHVGHNIVHPSRAIDIRTRTT